MVQVAVHEKYIHPLQAFGDLQYTIERAIQRYTLEKIAEQIAELRQREQTYQTRYGMNFPDFEQKIAADQNFVEHVEQHISMTWELDLADWEFCQKGIQDWTDTLNTILLT